MPLDFITLYVIVLINSASFALVWAVIALTYRSLTAARHWLAALLMTCASGPLLFLGDGHPILAFFGLTLVAGSFAMIWQGLRVFYGNSFQGWHVLAIMAATMAALLGLDPSLEETARSLGRTPWQTFRAVVIPHLVPALRAGHPMLDLELHEIATDEVVSGVLSHRFDAGIMALPVNEPGIEAETVLRDAFLVALSGSDTTLLSGPARPESIEADRLLLLADGHCLRDQALEEFFSSEAAQRSTQISLIASVANAWLTLQADQALLQVTRDTLKTYEESFGLTQRSFDVGVASALELRQARSAVDSARVNIEQYTRLVAQDRNALTLLLGQSVPAGLQSGDGLVLRIRARNGRLEPDQARLIAALSARHGNGLMDLTSRANLQLPGLDPAGHAATVAALAGIGTGCLGIARRLALGLRLRGLLRGLGLGRLGPRCCGLWRLRARCFGGCRLGPVGLLGLGRLFGGGFLGSRLLSHGLGRRVLGRGSGLAALGHALLDGLAVGGIGIGHGIHLAMRERGEKGEGAEDLLGARRGALTRKR